MTSWEYMRLSRRLSRVEREMEFLVRNTVAASAPSVNLRSDLDSLSRGQARMDLGLEELTSFHHEFDRSLRSLQRRMHQISISLGNLEAMVGLFNHSLQSLEQHRTTLHANFFPPLLRRIEALESSLPSGSLPSASLDLPEPESLLSLVDPPSGSDLPL